MNTYIVQMTSTIATNATNIIDFGKIHDLVIQGYINKTKHPVANLWIYNYTQKTQFEGLWIPETLQSRGLILNAKNEIVARPLPKFFNLEQHVGDLPSRDFNVFEKLDGSLGILYWLNGQPFIATRGSFNSDQANYANSKLLPKYHDHIKKFDRNYTYLFEIIYPINRIVVDYKEAQKLVLLAIIHTQNAKELDIFGVDYPDKAKFFKEFKDLSLLQRSINVVDEGYVLHWTNGLRLKYKFSEYVRLHKILTNVTNLTIWEYLRKGKDFEELLEKVPDEFFGWLQTTKSKIEQDYKNLKTSIEVVFKSLDRNLDRKSLANYIITNHKPLAHYLFALLDNKSTEDSLWNQIRPNFSKSFNNTDIQN